MSRQRWILQNRPFDEVHDVVLSYGVLVVPWRGGRWLMWSNCRKRFGLTYWRGFHNCTATGVK